jgi:aspartate aminotransferase-like enzyme
METYPIPMVPGPIKVPQEILDVYQINYGSADLEPEYVAPYNRCEANPQKIMATRRKVVIQTGEGIISHLMNRP